MKKSTKSIKIRAFRVKCFDINKNPADLVPALSSWLNSTTAEGRMLTLSSRDVDTEKDLCCHFEEESADSENKIFGTMVRLKSSSEVRNVPDDFFKKNTFSLNELNLSEVTGHKVINHFYYLLRGEHLVCNIPGNRTIKSFETYINWPFKTDMYSLTPVVTPPPETNLSQLKAITFEDPFASTKESEATKKKSINLKDRAWEFLAQICKDTPSLEEIELDKILTAKLILSFKKPRNMSDEDYQNSYGALLKPVGDLENVIFRDRKGRAIKGTEIESAKIVEIELTESGAISEPMLKLEMNRFIRELNSQ